MEPSKELIDAIYRDRVLRARRCVRTLQPTLPPRRTLSRLLRLGHGALASEGRGPVPSAGGLQALELYGEAVLALIAGRPVDDLVPKNLE